jgi:hypothetical protein
MEQASYPKVPKELATGKKPFEGHQQTSVKAIVLWLNAIQSNLNWTFLLSKTVIHWVAWDLVAGHPNIYLGTTFTFG